MKCVYTQVFRNRKWLLQVMFPEAQELTVHFRYWKVNWKLLQHKNDQEDWKNVAE